jgi:hypothetical protein
MGAGRRLPTRGRCFCGNEIKELGVGLNGLARIPNRVLGVGGYQDERWCAKAISLGSGEVHPSGRVLGGFAGSGVSRSGRRRLWRKYPGKDERP